MVICHCTAVNDREIRGEILSGALGVDDVAERCGAGGRCGNCRPMIAALLAEASVTESPATSAA
jgi:bacterioferritin-associated ferredoxin